MNVSTATEKALWKPVRGSVRFHEPIASHASLKVGGPADVWIEPEDSADLARALKICHEGRFPVYVIGNGSNILVSDRGLQGVVFCLSHPSFRTIEEVAGKIVAGAGALNTLFLQFAVERHYGGCEFLLGIPGSIGGAIAMNAGSHQQSVGSFVEEVELIWLDGKKEVLEKTRIPFGYRTFGIQDVILLKAVFAFPKADSEAIGQKLREYRTYRSQTQDLQHPSAGCIFKNPVVAGCSSGKLIDEAGLKGRRIGNAQVSQKHANFMINLGGASAKDIFELIQEVQSVVKKKFDVALEMEIKILK